MLQVLVDAWSHGWGTLSVAVDFVNSPLRASVIEKCLSLVAVADDAEPDAVALKWLHWDIFRPDEDMFF